MSAEIADELRKAMKGVTPGPWYQTGAAWFEREYTWVSHGGAWISERARSDTYEYAPTHWQPLPAPPSRLLNKEDRNG